MSLREYLSASRQARYSVTFALPLLLLYEGLTGFLPASALGDVRNGADVLLKTVFVTLGGRNGVTAFGVLLLAGGAWAVWQDRRRHPGPMRAGVLAGMLLESLVYAALFGFVVAALTAALLQAGAGGAGLAAMQGQPRDGLPIATQLVVSLGAGIYEELLFRVLLVTGLLGLATLLGWPRPLGVALAMVGSAVIFSSFHYVGPLGDTFRLASFTFRAVAGLVLSGLYTSRGFGITAWTHALYDVGLSLLGRL